MLIIILQLFFRGETCMKRLKIKRLFYMVILIMFSFIIIYKSFNAVAEDTGTTTTECVLKSITTQPDQKLQVEKGAKSNVTVKVICRGDRPAVGVTVDSVLTKHITLIAVSPASTVTDENGKATFTVTGRDLTGAEPAEIRFSAGDLRTKLDVKVQKSDCTPGSIKTDPEQVLILAPDQSGNVVVKVKCQKGSPAVNIKVDTLIMDGEKKISISPAANLTDESGTAVFTITGKKTTDKNPAKIKFSAGNVKTTLNVKIKSGAQ